MAYSGRIGAQVRRALITAAKTVPVFVAIDAGCGPEPKVECPASLSDASTGGFVPVGVDDSSGGVALTGGSPSTGGLVASGGRPNDAGSDRPVTDATADGDKDGG